MNLSAVLRSKRQAAEYLKGILLFLYAASRREPDCEPSPKALAAGDRQASYYPLRSRCASQSGSVRLNGFNASSTFKIIDSLI